MAQTCAFGLATVSSVAAILVSNLEQPTRATTDLSADRWATQSFVTDGQHYGLSSIVALLGNRSGSPEIIAALHAYGGLSGIGDLLSTFTVPPVPEGNPIGISLIPDVAVSLEPNTTYWLVLGASGAGSFGWSYAEGNGSTGPGSIGAFGYSTDAGLTWPPGTFDTTNPHQLRVEVAAIPEPAGAALGFALAAVSWLCGRQRHQRTGG